MAKKTSIQPEEPVLYENQTIVRKKLTDLKVNPLNIEIYPDEDIEDLKESISNNQKKILVPLVVTPDGVIISGNRRYKAAFELKIDEVNVIVEDVTPEDMEFRMIQYNVYRRKKYAEILNEIERLYEYFGRNQGRRSDLTESAEKIDVHAQVAKIVGIAESTMSNLRTIKNLKPEYIEKIDLGRTSIVKAWAACKHEVKVKIKEHAWSSPTTMLNQDFMIYNKSCGDMSEIEDNSVQLIITSPPYFQIRKYDGGSKELGWEKTPEEFVTNLALLMKDCYRVLKQEGSFFLNMGDCKYEGRQLNIPHKVLFELLKQGYHHIQTIIWQKSNSTPVQNFKYLQPSYEFIFHLTKDMKYTYNEDIGRPFLLSHLPQYIEQSEKIESEKRKPFHPVYGELIPFDSGVLYDIWTHHDFLKTASFQQVIEMLDMEDDPHPAQMNSIVPILPILLTTKDDDIVLDPFSGWATSGTVATMLGRKYRGYEISQKYYEGSLKRLAMFSREKTDNKDSSQ